MMERLIVVGGDAGGMSTASQARRRRSADELQIIAFERGSHTSYSACGIPYWIAGDVESSTDLVARSPETFRDQYAMDVRLRTEVEQLDLDRREVQVRELETGRTYREGFDQLVLGTGAVPFRPPLPGADAQGIVGVQTLDDGTEVLAELKRLTADGGPRPRAVVVGGGYIGVEMAEAMIRRGLEVTVVDAAAQPMSTLDPDMGRLVHDAMEGMGIDVRTGLKVLGFDSGAAGHVTGVVTTSGTIPADVVVLGMGVRPRTRLARDAGLPLGDSGGLRTDLRMRVLGQDGVWAAGDCVEVFDRVSGRFVHVPLGTHANKQGRVAGINIGGGYATFPGVVRTAVSKVCDVEIARTGLREVDADHAGFGYVTATITSTSRAGYFPGAASMTVKMMAEKGTGRLLGVQIVGREGAAKRIDTAAVALWNQLTVDDIIGLDLAYAPPFSLVWDPIQVAARKVADVLAG
jgi:NADPH-dependent 2,4-dienoyl-CoA reductase/sulfur reductase-like enzyme